MIRQNVAIIGVGHIGKALVYGLLNGKAVKPQNLILANPHVERLRDIKSEFKVKVTTDNIQAAKMADVIVIAVKTKVVKVVAEEIKNDIKPNAIIISVAACLTLDLLADYFKNKTLPIIRIMPNIPIAYGKGVIGWMGNKNVSRKEKGLVSSLLASLGYIVEYGAEEKLDKLSIISACGPGYISYFMHSLIKITKNYGFSERETKSIVKATFGGTLYHLEETAISPRQFLQLVSTKGGITEEVIKNLNEKGFYSILSSSIENGYDKIREIARELKK